MALPQHGSSNPNKAENTDTSTDTDDLWFTAIVVSIN